jgi:hypothetical protein
MMKPLATWMFASGLAACASTTSGARPHDMGAAQHQAAAEREEQASEPHAAQYNPNAAVTRERCASSRAYDVACWTSTTNPTGEHLETARRYRQMASDHRAASQALRDAEARACAGLSDDDRDMSPFHHREDIVGVEPLYASTVFGTTTRVEGAVVTFRAVPGMTAQWLQRVVDCHLSRNAALGHDVPEMAYCPLVPRGVDAKVSATATGFAVTLRSDDADTAAEVLRRSRALVAR